MWKNNRFVALRDPKKGGIHIAAASKGLSQSALEEIEENCLELIAKDRAHPGVCMYSMGTGGYIIAMAMKVAGNCLESRVHEIVRGAILAKEELRSFCQSYMTDNGMLDIFFPSTTDYDSPENWTVTSESGELRKGVKPLIDRISGTTALQLFHALKEVEKKRMKVQLIVEAGEELHTLALLSCMNEIAGTRLFIMANGECTLKPPDVLILEHATYQDMRRYRKMTLEQFLHIGSGVSNNQETEYGADVDEQRIQEITNFCLDYITNKAISDYDVYEALGKIYETEPNIYQRVLRKLRKELFRFTDVKYYSKRYMKLLFILFKKTTLAKSKNPIELELPPYDYCEMYLFLKNKSKNKRELKRFLVMLLETQMTEYIGQMNTYAIREAARNIEEL